MPSSLLIAASHSFHGSSAWSHSPCLIDVSANIDTDGAALPPVRCDISTVADISIFVCPSIALSSSDNRSPIEAPPSLGHGDFATFHLPAQLLADLSFPFYFLSFFMPFVVLNPKYNGPSGFEQRLAIVYSKAFLPVVSSTFGINFSLLVGYHECVSSAAASNSYLEHFIGFVSRLWVSVCRLRPELLQNVLRQIWRVGFFVRSSVTMSSQVIHV